MTNDQPEIEGSLDVLVEDVWVNRTLRSLMGELIASKAIILTDNARSIPYFW